MSQIVLPDDVWQVILGYVIVDMSSYACTSVICKRMYELAAIAGDITLMAGIGLENHSIVPLLSRLRNITSAYVFDHVADQAIINVLCPRKLNLYHANNITDMSHMTALHDVNLESCNIDTTILPPSIQRLKIMEHDLPIITDHLTSLTQLQICSYRYGPDVSAHTQLRMLKMEFMITCGILPPYAPNLRELKLGSPVLFDYRVYTNLTKLNVRNTPCELGVLSSLTDLTIHNYVYDAENLIGCPIVKLRAHGNIVSSWRLSQISTLRSLSFIGIDMPIPHAVLKMLTQIRTLKLIAVDGFESLAGMTMLTALSLQRNNVVCDADIIHLTSLTKLDLRNNRVVRGYVFTALTNLRTLLLCGADAQLNTRISSLTRLDVSIHTVINENVLPMDVTTGASTCTVRRYHAR